MSTMSTAVGIDAGNATSVIAAARGRGVDVILNEESSRETPSCLSFPPSTNHRLFGSAAVASHTLSPSSFFTYLKHHICTRSRHDNTRFSSVQLFAMLLAHLKSIAEKNLETSINACVIGIPSYFTDLQRRAYLHAAEIAGLKPLRLMHDLTATGLGYGIYKSDKGSVSHVAVIDVGECDTQVSILAFESGGMKVLSHASDPNLGGRDFDQVLYDYFAEKFKAEYKIDVRSNKKASVRLQMACEKVKKILSANAEAPLSIECLMEEKDVKGLIKREEFEKMCYGLIERVLEPCKKAMMWSGLRLDGLSAVELVGSGSRVPAIARVFSGYFGREPGRTINASECVARGCALHCAMLSPVFRVRDYEVQESYPFSIGFATEEGPISTPSTTAIFRRGQPFPAVKMFTLNKRTTFSLEAFYIDPAELPPGASTNISKYEQRKEYAKSVKKGNKWNKQEIGPFEAHSEKSRVKVKVRLNLHGIVYVESATLIEDEITDSPMRDGSCKVEDMDIDDESGPQSDNVEPAGKMDRRLRRRYIPVKEIVYGGMDREEFHKAHETEMQLQQQDLLMEQTRDRKNQLEAYVYDIRNKLFERYRSFASVSEKDGISTNLQQTEEWLYEDGDNETEKVYADKIEELKKLVDPLENRCKEEEARALATRELLNCIVGHRMAVDSLTGYERDAVLNECLKAEQWLRDRSQQQEALPRNMDPTLWSSEIIKKTDELDLMCKNISRTRGSPSRTENNQKDNFTK